MFFHLDTVRSLIKLFFLFSAFERRLAWQEIECPGPNCVTSPSACYQNLFADAEFYCHKKFSQFFSWHRYGTELLRATGIPVRVLLLLYISWYKYQLLPLFLSLNYCWDFLYFHWNLVQLQWRPCHSKRKHGNKLKIFSVLACLVFFSLSYLNNWLLPAVCMVPASVAYLPHLLISLCDLLFVL